MHGEPLSPEDLHAALVHLLRRRGYVRVPWASGEARANDEEEGQVVAAVDEIRREMEAANQKFPAEWLAARTEAGKARRGKSDDRVIFPRDLIEKEFRAIVEAQTARFPKLAEFADEMLYGPPDFGREHDGFHVFDRKTDAPDAGALSLYWPRFDNRGPGLDRIRPYDKEGRPVHRARRHGEDFVQGQFFLALQNFRLVEIATKKIVAPPDDFRDALVALWREKGKIGKKELEALVASHASGHALLEDQPTLTPSNLAKTSRSAYSRPTLRAIADTIEGGDRFDPPPPRLRLEGEDREEAVLRRLNEITSPLVRHRAELYVRTLHRLVSRYGKPDLVVVEAVRGIAAGKEAEKEIQRVQRENEARRKRAEKALSDFGLSAARGKFIRLASLLEEAGWKCPYCLGNIGQEDLRTDAVEVEHIVPRSRFPTNDWNNLTVAHRGCNQRKGARTPFEAFGSSSEWEPIARNAQERFRTRKRAVFLSQNAEELLEDRSKLAETAWIARVLRGLTCLKLGWETEDGRDPSAEPEAAPRYQVTNGSLTSFLRDKWNLNAALYPLGSGASDEDRDANRKKNRADVRHHAIDAMVIASTLPWAVHSLRDGKSRSIENPAGLSFESVRASIEADRIEVKFLNPTGWKAQRYKTTFLGKRAVAARKRKVGEDSAFVARESLAGMFDQKGKPKDAKWEKIYPSELGEYLREAVQLLGKSCLDRLCFAAFQRWREEKKRTGRTPSVSLPKREQVKVPIRSVRVIQAYDESGLLPLKSFQDGGPWVKREGFLEVRIFENTEGDLEPVFVPHSRLDPMFLDASKRQADGLRPIMTIRKGDVVKIGKAGGFPAGVYRMESIGQTNVTILPYFASGKDSLRDFGLPPNGGLNLKSFLKALVFD